MRRLSLALMILSLTGSCASIQRNYSFCKESNWQDLGYKIGKEDQNLQSALVGFNSMCSHFEEPELKPNLTMIKHGHMIGVKEYCTYSNGYKAGFSQKVTSINCSKTKHKPFFKGITKGVNDYCSYENGYKNGLEGIYANPVCKKGSHKSFYKGVMKGVAAYCTFATGMKMGQSGKEYSGACKDKSEESFLRGMTIGQNKSQITSLRKKVSELEIEKARLEERVNYLEGEKFRLEAQVSNLELELQSLRATQNSL